MYTGIERRIFHRIEGEVVVKYKLLGNEKANSVLTKNISAGGMMIPLLKKIAPGTILELEIFRNNPSISSKCRGKIMWVAKRIAAKDKRKKYIESGIEFIGLSFMYLGGLISDLKVQSELMRLSSVPV